VLKEKLIGRIINTATQKPFTYSEDCVGRNPHMAYSASSTEDAVKALLKAVFKRQTGSASSQSTNSAVNR
jgi:hypothetical protein